MVSNSKRDKTLAKIVLLILTLFLVYQTKIFVPGWAYHLSHKSGVAKIEKLNEQNNERILIYSYHNEYLEKEVRNSRNVTNLKHWEILNSKNVFSITYAKYFSSLVIFTSLDKEPMFLMRVFIYLIELIAIGLVVGVLFDKVSLEMLAGVRQEEKPSETK